MNCQNIEILEVGIQGPPGPPGLVDPSQQAGIDQLFSGTFTEGTYDGSGKLISYRRNGALHTVTYVDANTVRISNETGSTRVVNLDSSGRVQSYI